MLQYIRDQATGWIAWTIIILICIPFALFGINQYFSADQGLAVARVNDAEIGYYQYRSAYQQQRDQLRQMFGGTIPAGLLDDSRLRRQTLESLINDEILVQQSLANGLRVGDAQLAGAIRTLPAFQQDGAFSQSLYDAYVRARGLSPQGFELDLRRAKLAEQVIAALRRTAIVTGQELDAALRLRTEQRRFRVARLDPAALKVPEPTEQQIRERYDAHPERYVQPERVRIRYVELARDEIAQKLTVDDSTLRSLYEQAKASYRTPEQREARHILLTLPIDASEADTEAARAKLAALRERITGGADFAEVAKAESQDPGSAPIGGGLGYFGRGVMDPAFEDAAFSLDKDGISEPVRSRFGWHLIQVTGIQPEQVRSFEDAREEVLREYQARQADQIFAQQAERLATLAFEHPESLEAAADALGVKPHTSEPFGRQGTQATGIALQPKVRAAAFSDEVLGAGNNSELIEIGDNRALVLRVAEREAARPKTLDEVRESIRGELRQEVAAAQAANLGKQMVEALQGGTGMDEAAAAAGTTWADEQRATRDTPAGIAPEIAGALFKLEPPAGDPRFVGTALKDGGFAVVALLAVEAPKGDPAQQKQLRAQVETELESGLGQQDFSAVVRTLRERAQVEILEQNLRREDG